MTDADILALAAEHRITIVAGSVDGSAAALLAFARALEDVARADEAASLLRAWDEQARKMTEAAHA